MGFFNSLYQVRINKKNFKEWEKQNQDKLAQRDALAKKSKISQAELDRASAKGKVIMDVIDIMDTHSEEVSENVEQTIMPIAMILPEITTFLTSMGLLKFQLIPICKKYEDAVNKFVKDNDFSKFVEDNFSKQGPISGVSYSDPVTLFTKKKIKILESHPDIYSKELCQKVKDLKEQFQSIPDVKNMPKAIKFFAFGVGATFALTYILSNVVAAKMQVRASRVARWQSRQDLSDPKYFVQYTDEQIKQAQENIKNKKPEKKGLFGAENKFDKGNSLIKSLIGTVKDNKNWKKWKSKYNIEDRKVKRELTQREKIDAQKDKEVIQRITKQINNKAEEYSENMEVAAGVLIGGTPFLGAGIGAIVNKIMTKTGLGDKMSQKNFNKFLSQIKDPSLKKYVIEAKKSLEPKVINGKTIKAGLMDNINFFTTMAEAVSRRGDEPRNIIKMLKKIYYAIMSTPFGRKGAIAIGGGVITGLVGALIGLKLQKSSARAGRYIAKREIEQNNMNFVGYNEDEFNSVKDVKAQPEKFSKKIMNYITFLPRVIGEYFQYSKYKRTQAKQDKMLLEELTKQKVSEKQLQEAKDLQRKVFSTFENVDDKSQEYSESMEAVNEMLQPLIPFIGFFIASVPIIIGGVKLYKGGLVNATDKISGFLAKHTGFLKGKKVHNYLDEVSQNVTRTVEKHNFTPNKAQNALGVDLESLKDILNVEKLNDLDLSKIQSHYEEAFKEIIGAFEEALEKGKSREFIGEIRKANLRPEINYIADKFLDSSVSNEQVLKIYKNLKTILKNIPSEDLRNIVKSAFEEFQKNPEKFIDACKNGKLKDIFLTKGIAKASAIASGTWMALGLVLSYTFESIFANMQKRAGRLGVMKALDEMNDVKYYADEKASSEQIELKGNEVHKSPILNQYINKIKQN